MNTKVWFLYDAKGDARIDGLSEATARLLVQSIDSEKLSHWFAWKDGWNDWKPVEKISEFEVRPTKIEERIPETPKIELNIDWEGRSEEPTGINDKKSYSDYRVENPVVFENVRVDRRLGPPPSPIEEPIEKTLVSEVSHERRRDPRYRFKLRVVLEVKGVTFRSITKNISLGGISLEHEIPDSIVGKSCNIFLSSPKLRENIHIPGTVIRDSFSCKRVQFDQGADFLTRLTSLIERTYKVVPAEERIVA